MEIDFYWDPGSTNTYFAWHLLKPIASKFKAEICPQPFNLGFVFRSHNYVLMDEPAAKMRNRRDDLIRWAKKYQLPFRVPDIFPIKTSRILRGALASRTWQKEIPFMEEIFRRYWEHNDASVATDDGLMIIARALGMPENEYYDLFTSDAIGTQLRACTQHGLDKGVFGAPTLVIENEIYWGKDRMEFVVEHLQRMSAD
ncbi:MAG: DsbA family protein [Pseudomonadales bacterium]|jgi:2-hydroxychromene-2-carboxylate isomerase|nr:DsbA family protein [Pseudomonadales bacterium]